MNPKRVRHLFLLPAVWKSVWTFTRFRAPNCSPPCQNGGMCLRPQLCVCKPGTKGSVCEDSTKQETAPPGGPGPVTPPWPIPQRSVQQTFSKKVQIQQKASPMTQMTFTLKQKASGLPQQMQSQYYDKNYYNKQLCFWSIKTPR